MLLPKSVRSFKFVVRSKKTARYQLLTTNYLLPTTYSRQRRSGFTLIELLIAITIIAIIIGIGTLSWTKSQEKARDGKRKSDAKTIQQGLEEYFQTNRQYPLAASCSNDASGNWLSGFKNVLTGTPTYLKDVPRDPANNAEFKYCYEPTTTNLKYNLYLRLENTADPDAESPLNPAPPPAYNYSNYRLTNP